MYVVFSVNKADRKVIDSLLLDELVNRQSITQKDGSIFGLDNRVVVIIEGSEAALEVAAKIVGAAGEKLPPAKATDIYNKVKEEEKRADSGMGFLFG
ncbi:MAG: hypothetical protein M1151_01450 [Candidatus Thermoplasmatota archaeon]|jgi:beta-lactamase class A|nr:hypothetical protein [Candidatus Thermoplasmatota archaeon]MCL5785321.1 hypothetical protein [Candidatus Thermoplasmatota archaeon]